MIALYIAVAVLLILIGAILLPSAYKTRVNSAVSGLGGINYFEDFINSSIGTPYNITKAVGGVAQQVSLPTRSSMIALYNSSPTDAVSISTNDPINPSSGSINMGLGTSTNLSTEFCFVAQPTPTGNTTFQFGLGPISATYSVYFQWNRGVSPNWVCATQTSGTVTSFVTAVPVAFDLVIGAAFTRLKIVSTTSRSLFYINGVLVHTSTTPWPSNGSVLVAPVASMSTITGSSDINTVYIDYMWLQHQFGTVRLSP